MRGVVARACRDPQHTRPPPVSLNYTPPVPDPTRGLQRVLDGTSRHDLHGKHGVATDYHGYGGDLSRDRYSVLLDSGESYKFGPTAVRAARVEAAGGARPRAKGKGKQGGRMASEGASAGQSKTERELRERAVLLVKTLLA